MKYVLIAVGLIALYFFEPTSIVMDGLNEQTKFESINANKLTLHGTTNGKIIYSTSMTGFASTCSTDQVIISNGTDGYSCANTGVVIIGTTPLAGTTSERPE